MPRVPEDVRARAQVMSGLRNQFGRWLKTLDNVQLAQLRSQFPDMLSLWDLVLTKTVDPKEVEEDDRRTG